MIARVFGWRAASLAIWRPDGEIRNVDECPHDGTKRLRKRGRLEPLVQGTALVRLEVTETDPAYRRGVDDARHGVPYTGVYALHPGMVEKRLLVLDEKMVELKPDIRRIGRNAIDIRSDLGDVGHDSLLK